MFSTLCIEKEIERSYADGMLITKQTIISSPDTIDQGALHAIMQQVLRKLLVSKSLGEQLRHPPCIGDLLLKSCNDGGGERERER